MKKVWKIFVLAPLLMAFQCGEDEIESTLVFDVYKVNITPAAVFSANDTIWISGKISSNVFDTAVNDSVFNFTPQIDDIAVYKFIQPTTVANSKDGLDQFELIIDRGNVSFLRSCENAQMQIVSELELNEMFYSYRVGQKPLSVGDYVISLRNGLLQNANRNTEIIGNYPIQNHPNQIGFDTCGRVSWRFLNESDREFYFSVE